MVKAMSFNTECAYLFWNRPTSRSFAFRSGAKSFTLTVQPLSLDRLAAGL